MRVGWTRLVGVLGSGVLVLAGCGENTGLPPEGAPTAYWSQYGEDTPVRQSISGETPPAAMPWPTPAPAEPTAEAAPTSSSSRYPPVAVASGPVKFVPCSVARAKPGRSNLTPRTIPDADPVPAVYEFRPSAGKLTVEHVMTLPLPGGWLGAGAAYDAAYATTRPVEVADRDVTAEVYFGVLNAGPGETLALVELRLANDRPVAWAQLPGLNVVTDGADGGFFSGVAGTGPENPDFDDYIDAFQAGVTAPRSNLCVSRRNEDQPRPTGFLFTYGGDGRYPTYVGRNGKGEIVSVVHDGLQVPWALNGLPGTPPPDVARAVADRRAGKP